MPSIEFYHMPESPFCRCVEMGAELVGVTLNKHHINLAAKEQFKDEFLKLNPLHKVPFIVDDGIKLGESRAILTYLANRYMPDGNNLYPKEVLKRAKVDELLYIDAIPLNQAALSFLGRRMYGKEPEDGSEEKFREILKYIDFRLENNGGKKFFLFDNITIADVALASSFSYIEAFDYDLGEFPSLSNYIKRLKKSIPKYDTINDGPTQNLRQFIKQIRKK